MRKPKKDERFIMRLTQTDRVAVAILADHLGCNQSEAIRAAVKLALDAPNFQDRGGTPNEPNFQQGIR